jgi:cysteinyl-tRNA synthetase
MWFANKKALSPVRLTNTLSGAKEEFRKKGAGPVLMYSCGPTVYGPQHIGNLRAAVFSDTVARTLTCAGYKVKRVVNITDVGHLVGDGDEGEDKMSVGAKREHATPQEIAERYTKQYLEDISALNIDTKAITFPRATAYIKEQIDMIRTLENKGLAYETSDGMYFDTKKFPDYGALGNVKKVKLQAGTRVALGEKKNEHDFVLWRKAKPNDLQQWDSPWGKGNPGWSIECSAMAVALLGPTIDVHTGGQDHIQVHHNNEIAQSEAASGKKPFVRYWLHNAFLTIDGEKISKSLGNIYTLSDVKERGIRPLALRYLFLQAHYRSPLTFSWETLTSAETGLNALWNYAAKAKRESHGRARTTQKSQNVLQKIKDSLFDDLNTSYALAVLFSDALELAPNEQWHVISEAERMLGLSLTDNLYTKTEPLPEEIKTLENERARARANKDFARSDELRIEIERKGYRVEDGPEGSVIRRL